MLTVQIVINVAGQSAGSPSVAREFPYTVLSPTPPEVTLSLASGSGITSYEWAILDQPDGASAELSSETDAAPTFIPTVDIPGTYLFECRVNGGTAYARNALSFDTQYLGLRIPAAGEMLQFSAAKGWALALREIILSVDSNTGSGGERKAAVLSITDCTSVPPSETLGDRYILDDTSGTVHVNWDGANKGDIVQFDGLVWISTTPQEGWTCYVDDVNQDALYVDDGTPAWELRTSVGIFSVGDGTESILRTTNSTGTAVGDYSFNAGWGGLASADYSFQMGLDNIISADSNYSAVFGGGPSGSSLHNVIGEVTQSLHTYVFGSGNTVDGDPSGLRGGSFIIGARNDIDTDLVFCFGEDNIITDSTNGNGGNLVFGIGNEIDGRVNFVVGAANTLSDADGNFCVGITNEVTADYCGAIGNANTLSANFGLAIGYDIELSGAYAFAHGEGHEITSDYSACFGHTNSAIADYSFVPGGKYAIARWEGQVVHSGYGGVSDDAGDFQSTISVPLSGETIGLVPAWTEIGFGTTSQLTMQQDSSYACTLELVARKRTEDGGETPKTKMWQCSFLATMGLTTPLVVGSTEMAIYSTSNDDEDDWDVRVSVDTDRIVVEVLGSAHASLSVYWQGSLRCQEVCTTRPIA